MLIEKRQVQPKEPEPTSLIYKAIMKILTKTA